MRFVIAIVLFLASAVTMGIGVAQRTVWAPPEAISHSITVTGGAPVTVIGGATLNAFPGRQTVEVKGAGPIVMAYGRSVDVAAWVGDAKHAVLSLDPATGELVSELVPGTETELPNPYGSDLWLDDFQDNGSLRMSVTVPDDVSILIASDGIAAAPARVTLSWPVDNRAPATGWLFVLGGGMLLLGLIFLLWAIYHMRSTRGPKRKMPKLPKQKPVKPARSRVLEQRRAIGVAAGATLVAAMLLPALGVPSLNAPTAANATAIAARAVVAAPNAGDQSPPTPTPSTTPGAESNEAIPAITTRQISRVVERVKVAITQADASMDSKLAAERLTGPALQQRTVDYAIRSADSAITSSLPVIPENGSVVLALPQQIPANGDGWPRAVFAVVAAPSSEEVEPVPSIALMLVQPTARENYKVEYFVTLHDDVPQVAEATIGAPKLAMDSALLDPDPKDLAPKYADVLMRGNASEFAKLFDLTSDAFVPLWGKESMDAISSALPAVAQAAFTTVPGDAPIIALSTFDGGALVTVDMKQTVTVTPVEAGATVSPTGSVKALSGVSSSTRGVTATYGAQLLFVVPPLDSKKPVTLIGFTQGLISASEVP